MLRRLYLSLLCAGCFGIFSFAPGIHPAWSQSQTVEREIRGLVRPSLHRQVHNFFEYVSCYDDSTGKPQNCPFTHKVLGLEPGAEQRCDPNTNRCGNAGHQHNFPTHPAGSVTPGAGSTQGGQARITHELPAVSGNIQTETLIDVPGPGWRCRGTCFTPTQTRVVTTLRIGIPNLEELPERTPQDNDVYITTLRGDKVNHPRGHWGTGETLEILRQIAAQYRAATRRPLSINDISLPRGGLFDIFATYAPPHIEHRTGTDADIDQDGTPCQFDELLSWAVQSVAGEAARPRLLCESGGRKHIDFD